jgi:hypothetical protein
LLLPARPSCTGRRDGVAERQRRRELWTSPAGAVLCPRLGQAFTNRPRHLADPAIVKVL